jgi:hypothetical protein
MSWVLVVPGIALLLAIGGYFRFYSSNGGFFRIQPGRNGQPSQATLSDEAKIRQSVGRAGGAVVWLKATDATDGAPGVLGMFAGPVSYYDVLVETDGLRQIQFWRVDSEGAFRN